MKNPLLPRVLPSRSEILRALARETYDVLAESPSDKGRFESLLRRIDEVRAEMNLGGSAPVSRWLDNLRRELLETSSAGPAAN
jgi:hypothetical protein